MKQETPRVHKESSEPGRYYCLLGQMKAQEQRRDTPNTMENAALKVQKFKTFDHLGIGPLEDIIARTFGVKEEEEKVYDEDFLKK